MRLQDIQMHNLGSAVIFLFVHIFLRNLVASHQFSKSYLVFHNLHYIKIDF